VLEVETEDSDGVAERTVTVVVLKEVDVEVDMGMMVVEGSDLVAAGSTSAEVVVQAVGDTKIGSV
jgi:hypothetical protein